MTLRERDELFAAHQPLAIFLSRVVGSGRKRLDEDLAQEALLALWDATRQFDPVKYPGVPFAGFARRRIKNALLRAIELEEKQGLTHAPTGIEREMVDVDRLSEEQGRNDLADVLWAAINSLEPIEQRLLVLRTGLDGKDPMPLIECASKCQLSFATAKRMMAKIRESIRTELQRHGMDPEKWMHVFARKVDIKVS